MALRRIPLHRSAIRPHTFMGGDRELVLFSSAVAFVLCVLATNRVAAGVGLLFWLVALFTFRRMAKADPLMRLVWLRNRMYKKFYPARSQPWRKNHHDQSTPFARRKKRA